MEGSVDHPGNLCLSFFYRGPARPDTLHIVLSCNIDIALTNFVPALRHHLSSESSRAGSR